MNDLQLISLKDFIKITIKLLYFKNSYADFSAVIYKACCDKKAHQANNSKSTANELFSTETLVIDEFPKIGLCSISLKRIVFYVECNFLNFNIFSC